MATRRWLGAAIPIAQVETMTLGGTWVAGETLTVTINGRDLVLTIGTTATVAQIAIELERALEDATTALGAAYTVTERGINLAEFREFTVASTSTTVVLTGSTKGKPFIVTVAETSTLGTFTTATTTAATGPNFFTNADNWSGAAVPVDSDDIVFDSGSISLLYGLDQSAVSPLSLTITMGFVGKIGLARTNQDDSSYPYPEYRSLYLSLGVAADAVTNTITIGQGAGSGSARINIASGSGQAVLLVLSSGQPELDEYPAIQWTGTHASNTATINKGSVGIAYTAGETATVATLNVGYQTNVAGDSVVYCGAGATLTTINQSGGTLTTNSNVVTVSVVDGEWIHYAGTVTTLNLDKGDVRYRSTGTLATANVGSGGNLDFRQDMRARTVTNCDLFEAAELHDPFGSVTFTNGIDLNRTTPEQVTLDIQHHKRITLGSVA